MTSYIYKTYRMLGHSKNTALQESVMAAERQQLKDGIQYSETEVAQANVHSRQDLILVVGSLAELSRKMTSALRLLFVVVLLLILIVLLLLVR